MILSLILTRTFFILNCLNNMKISKSKYFYLYILAIIALPMIVLNLYINVWQAIIEISGGRIQELVNDFGVYTRTIQFFLQDSNKIYYVAPGMPPNWFIYPPLSVLIFLPFGIIPEPWNLILWRLLNIALYYFSIKILINIFTSKYNILLNKKERISIYIIFFGLASFFLNINHGQVNIILLFFAVMALNYLLKNKTIISGLFFSLGFWLKLYSAMIFPIYFKNKQTVTKAIIAMILFIVILPLVLSPIIPLNEYSYYFFNLTPYIINTPLDMSLCNQSIMSFLMHLHLPANTFGQYPLFYVLPWIKTVNLIGLIISVATISLIYLKNKEQFLIWTFSSLLILAPVFSITGWESVYILAVPIIMHTLLLIREEKPGIKYLFILPIVMMYIPKPPSHLIAQYTSIIPLTIQILFFFRFMLLSIFLIIYNYFKIKKAGISDGI